MTNIFWLYLKEIFEKKISLLFYFLYDFNDTCVYIKHFHFEYSSSS